MVTWTGSKKRIRAEKKRITHGTWKVIIKHISQKYSSLYQYYEIECRENPPWKYFANIPHCWWLDIYQAIKTSPCSMWGLSRGEDCLCCLQCPLSPPSVVRLSLLLTDSLVSSSSRATGNRSEVRGLQTNQHIVSTVSIRK